MTINVAFASTADGYLQSSSSSYATALAGANLTADTSDDLVACGQILSGSTYFVYQAFYEFTTPVDTDERVIGAYVAALNFSVNPNAALSRNLEIRDYDWGGTLTTADWRTTAQLAALPLLGQVTGAEDGQNYVRAGSNTLLSTIQADEEVSVVLVTNRQRTGTTPSSDERLFYTSADLTGTGLDPAVVYTTLPRSTLNRVGGQCAVMLSDGTHAYLESEDVLAPNPLTITIKHRNASGTVTTVATIEDDPTLGFFGTGQESLQAFALVRDDADNLYVLGHTPSAGNQIAGKAYTKGVGHTWTAQTRLSAALPSYDTVINSIAAAWHATGGTAGTILAVCSHGPGTGHTNHVSYALLNCDSLLAGTGTLLRGSGTTDNVLFTLPSTTDFVDYQDRGCGTGLDVVAAPGSTDRGFAVLYNRNDELSVTRYTLNAGGTGFIGNSLATDSAFLIEHDADSKARVLGIDSTTFAAVHAGTIRVRQNLSGTGQNTLGGVDFTAESIDSMPLFETLLHTSAWDAIYVPDQNKIFWYYFDINDGRRLLRTGFDLDTMLPDLVEAEVNDTVGASGSTNLSLRAPRGKITGGTILLAVGNQTAGGTRSTIYITDTLNTPPTTPTLTPKANFDATQDATFAWTFNDPDPGDTQSAYQVQINTSEGASAYDSGKVTSSTAAHLLPGGTLTNPGDWQWRVRTWDALDQPSPFSGFGNFSTSATGTVTITDPATDNPPDLITDNVTVTWEVTGATQDEYRVRVVRTDTETVHSDTGFVLSAATSHEVTGLLSDVEYRIEVTVRDSGVPTNTATRLVTPDYSSPEQPLITVTAHNDDGYIEVAVTNPPPEGDVPEPTTNLILRRLAGSGGAYETIGACDPDSSFRDYTAASGVAYEYVARATV